MRFSVLAAAAVLAGTAAAHPGHDHSKEIAQRAAYMASGKRGLGHCAAKNKARGIEARNINRRAEVVKAARQKRGLTVEAPHLKVRDGYSVLNTTHLSEIDYTPDDRDIIFAGNRSCILSPEVTIGPYYVAGEYVRCDLTEDQIGVPLILDVQVIDVATCDPVVDTMLDIWQCNSTGVYAGVVAAGNGDSSVASNINTTFLRGLQITKEDGVAQFETLVPGHYIGRTPHIHVVAHHNGTILRNHTYSGGTASHIGQLFFDDALYQEVLKTEPYASNTQKLTTNAVDNIFFQESLNGDPVVEYSLLGDSIEDGVFAWITFGIDLEYHTELRNAVTLTKNGGVVNPNAGPAGGRPPNGTAPAGAPPAASTTQS